MKYQDFRLYSYGEMTDFLPVPRLLISHPLYRTLSTEAKIIYALLLEKMGECKCNHWYDEDNKAYILFPDYKMQEYLNLSTEMLMSAYGELSNIGLVERQPQELDKPTLIYLKKFHYVQQADVKMTSSEEGNEPPSTEEYHARLKEYEEHHLNNVIPFCMGG